MKWRNNTFRKFRTCKRQSQPISVQMTKAAGAESTTLMCVNWEFMMKLNMAGAFLFLFFTSFFNKKYSHSSSCFCVAVSGQVCCWDNDRAPAEWVHSEFVALCFSSSERCEMHESVKVMAVERKAFVMRRTHWAQMSLTHSLCVYDRIT